MQANFNEVMPQDESYYILDAKEGANVYLGFQENIKFVHLINLVSQGFRLFILDFELSVSHVNRSV